MSSWYRAVRSALKQAGVRFVAHLPDSNVAPLVGELEDDPDFETVLVTREEQAVGVLAGAWLAGTRGALVCQSSGLANAINALASQCIPAHIPFVGVVTRRGNLGEFNDAQVPAGYGMDRILDAIGLRNTVVTDPGDVEERVRLAAETAFSTRSPYVVLVEQTVTGRKDEVSEA